MEERPQKILSRAGFGSRRDPITVDGQPIQVKKTRTYVTLHKPRGVLSIEGDGTGRLRCHLDPWDSPYAFVDPQA